MGDKAVLVKSLRVLVKTESVPDVVLVDSGQLFYSVLVSVPCPKALYHLESDNLFRIIVVVDDWLG